MDTRSLLYFIAVAEEGNIGRAAARLHITQPALTRQIHALEEELGVSLFVRTSSGVDITPAGTAMLDHARTIKVEMTQAKLDARQAEQECSQQMNIGVYGSAIFSIIPQVLKRFADQYPNVEFVLHNTRKDQQVELLRDGSILLAFDRFPPQESDMAYETVYREGLHVAMHKDHPLAAREIIDVHDLDDELRIGANFDNALASSLSQVFGFKSKVKHRADDQLTTLALVSQGFGITFAPPSIQALQIPNVIFRPYAGGPNVPFDVQCMYRKHDRSTLLHAMLETVRAYRADHEDGSLDPDNPR